MVTVLHRNKNSAFHATCRAVEGADGWRSELAGDPILNFMHDIFDVVALENESESEYPKGFFERVVDNIRKQPSLLLAIEVWNAEENLLEETPQADGLLGSAAAGAKRMVLALSRVRFPGEQEGEQK